MSDNHSLKIGLLYSVIAVFLVLFLSRAFTITITKPPYFVNPKKKETDLAFRGEISSDDNFKIATNKKNFTIAVVPKYIDKNKIDIFINLMSIYTNKPPSYYKKKLKTPNRVILLKNVPYKIKKNLQYLSTLLDIKKVFLRVPKKDIVLGLEIFENPSTRDYIFKDTLEPILGFVRLNKKSNQYYGKTGLENFYNEELTPKQNGLIISQRDVKGRLIYSGETIVKKREDGFNLTLNINLILQRKIEKILDKFKQKLNTKEILAVIMNSQTGQILTIASSNRYNPKHIKPSEIPNLKMDIIQYSYEPGSVMKPITLAMLLEHKKVNPFEILNAHNGIFYFKRNFTIYDDEKFKYLNVIQAVIHSSNIVFAQLGLRLTPAEFRDGLLKFGFSKKSGIDLPYEEKGKVFSTKELLSETHRASNAFGYALQANLIQLLKAYNSFNNNGIMVTPRIVKSINNKLLEPRYKQIISPSTAQTILNILRKVVLQGTAKKTDIKGLFIAGKTGTAKINKNGKYIKGLYNSTFIGFVNDKSHKYTIAVLSIKPDKKHYFASQTSVVVFKNIVETMLDMGLLKKR